MQLLIPIFIISYRTQIQINDRLNAQWSYTDANNIIKFISKLIKLLQVKMRGTSFNFIFFKKKFQTMKHKEDLRVSQKTTNSTTRYFFSVHETRKMIKITTHFDTNVQFFISFMNLYEKLQISIVGWLDEITINYMFVSYLKEKVRLQVEKSNSFASYFLGTQNNSHKHPTHHVYRLKPQPTQTTSYLVSN